MMKNLPLHFLFLTFALFSNTQAATIFDIQSGVSVYSGTVTGHSGKFQDQDFSGNLNSQINKKALSDAVTGSDLTKYAWTADFHMPTGQDNAYIDLSFGNSIYNGDGADLVLFFAGNATVFQSGDVKDFMFSIDVGANGTNEGGLMGVTSSTTFYNHSGVLEELPSGLTDETLTEQQKIDLGVSFFASYALIDLDTFGFDQTTPLGDIRVYLGDSSMPALAALGAYHVTAVPLPLSSVLFGSGLALLSLIRRKKQI